MQLKRRHGMLGFAVVGGLLSLAVLSQANTTGPQQTGNHIVPMALQGDWEKVPYPALDRLIRERAAEARAREAAALKPSRITLAHR